MLERSTDSGTVKKIKRMLKRISFDAFHKLKETNKSDFTIVKM